jgi:ParB/RepB/Spo0J family partition protein
MTATTNHQPRAGMIVTLDPARVKPFAAQPRQRFRGIAKLAASILAVGQVTPITVTTCDDPGYDAELVDGERRLRACAEAHVYVRAVFDDGAGEDRYIRSVAANFCRQGHDPVETMEAVLRLRAAGRTLEQVGQIFGKTSTWAAQYASLSRLAPAILRQLQVAGEEVKQTKKEQRAGGRVVFSVALLLIHFPHAKQAEILDRIRAGKMSAAQAHTFVRRQMGRLKIKPRSHQSPAVKFRTVTSAVTNCWHVVDRYLGLPGLQIQALIGGASAAEKRKLEKLLEDLCESLLMLSDALGKRV